MLLLAHVAIATTGTAVGLLCGRPVIHGIGWSVVIGDGSASTLTLAAQAALGLTLSTLAAATTVAVRNRR